MSEADKNTQEQRPKNSKWATASVYSALVGLALILLSELSYKPLLEDLGFDSYIVYELLLGVGLVLIIFGFAAGIIGLRCIKASNGNLMGTGLAILGIIISSIPIAFSIYAAYIFYVAVGKNI